MSGEVREIETAWIPLSDGCRLAANLFGQVVASPGAPGVVEATAERALSLAERRELVLLAALELAPTGPEARTDVRLRLADRPLLLLMDSGIPLTMSPEK